MRHVAIIGAGIGGLAAAVVLAARGLGVTVCEAADAPGGKARQRRVDGVAIDAGPTVFTMRDVFDALADEAGGSLDDVLSIRPATLLARHAWDEARLDLVADPLANEDAIADFAGPDDAAGYRAFRAEAARIFRTLDRPFLRDTQTNPLGLTWRLGWRRFADLCAIRPYETLWRALGDHFRDPRLRQLFGRYATYSGASPFRCPATLMLIAHVEASGVWLVEGGIAALAEALADLARRNGARLRYASPVGRILTERGRAAGIELASGERVAADAVVCNADAAALADGAFGERAGTAMPRRRRSLSALVWTAHAKTDGFPLARHNVFFSPDYPAEFAALDRRRLPGDPSVYVCALDRDRAAAAAPGDRERLQIIVNAPADGDLGAPAPQEIERCTLAMRTRLSRAGLSVDWTAPATLTTPHDFARRYPSTGGALYGPASHGWAAAFRRQGARTRIPGLYCAGGSCHPGAGVPMAALSGRLAAATLIQDWPSASRSPRGAMAGGIATRPATTAPTG